MRGAYEKGGAMATTLDLDKQTAAFVWQLEEQRKLEKTLLVERVRRTKEGAESVFQDIKTRVAVLERLNGAVSATCIAPIGWSKLIYTGADSVSAPNTIGFGICDGTSGALARIRYIDDTTYLRLSENPYFVEQAMPNKSAHARVGANASLWDTLGYVHAGYVTPLEIPASAEPTTVSIMSRLNTLFKWVEANAVGEEWYAHVSATARLWVTYDGEFRQAPPALFVNVLATPSQMRTHHDIPSLAPSAALAMQVSPPAGNGTTIHVYESIELVATTPNGHAYLDGIFSWEPLAVQLKED